MGKWRSRAARLVAALLAVSTCPTAAPAETITPQSIEFSVEAKHESTASSCVIMMTALNYPVSPEALNFRAGVWQGIDQNSRSVSLTGFTLDVGNLKFQNGLIVGTTPLAAAAFASRSFNSFGRLYDVDMEDGGHGAHTADPHVAIDFLTAVWAGDFEVAFAAKNIPLERTYHIASAPSADVIRQFKDCLGTL